jgi:hypothetical protein
MAQAQFVLTVRLPWYAHAGCRLGVGCLALGVFLMNWGLSRLKVEA